MARLVRKWTVGVQEDLTKCRFELKAYAPLFLIQ